MQQVGRQRAGHAVIRMSELSNVVGSVAVEVLHTVGTGSRVELATSRLVIIGVEHKLQIIEAHLMGRAVHLMITPEVGIGETGQHHGDARPRSRWAWVHPGHLHHYTTRK